jgi:hypothetical protein
MSCENVPRLRVNLSELNLMQRDNLTLRVEDEESGAGGALVNGAHEGDVGRRHFCDD